MTRLLLPLLASTSLFSLIACTTDTPTAPTTGQFGGADEELIARAIMAASGTDTLMVFFMASSYATVDGLTSCPAVVRNGATVTVTGGCDTDEGRVEGRLVMVNVPGLGGNDNDPDAPQSLTFEDFSVRDADGTWFVDGSVSTDPATRITTSDFTLDLGGVAVTQTMSVTTLASGGFTAAAGSSIDVEGLGEVEVSGTWNLSSSAPSGQLVLSGDQQELVVEVADSAKGCIPYTIDGGAAGELCNGNDAGE